jgi:site-specific recombinase XerD
MVEQFLRTVDSPNTADAYRRDLAKFLNWLGSEALSTLKPADLLNYVAYLRDEDYAPASINRHLSAVRAFLRWAALVEEVPTAVYGAAQAVKGVKLPKRLPQALTTEQVERLLEQPNLHDEGGARDYAFLKLALASGGRLSELVALNIEDLDFARQQAVVDGKGSKERVVFFDQDAAAALLFYLGKRGNPQSGPLFVNHQGARISHRWIQRALAAYGEAAGVEDMTPHRLRHTFATELLDASGDIAAVSEMLGHASVATTKIYTSGATLRLRRVYDTARAVRLEQEDNAPRATALVLARGGVND